MRLLLDTDMLIDYYARRQPFFRAWTKLRCAEHFGDVELWVPAPSFMDAFRMLTKACDPVRVQEAFLGSLAFLHVCSIDGRDVEAAARAGWSDFESCLIDRAAQKIGADFILAHDAQRFERAEARALSPDAFFDWLRDVRHIEYEGLSLDVGLGGGSDSMQCEVKREACPDPISIGQDGAWHSFAGGE